MSLVVRKQSGSNVVSREVAKAARAELEALGNDLEKRGVRVAIPTDNSVYIARSIHDVQFDLLFGAALAIVVILIFLMDGRATLISALAIPTSVVASFAFISVMGFTFNNMTMLALSLAIGILVDDAIVVIENIHRHLKQGKTALVAARDATSEIFLAVLAMTSTIIAVFVPVAVMKGIVGRFFLQFGLTVSFAVATSMLVSFTLTPMLAARLLKHGEDKKNWFSRLVDGALAKLEAAYARLVAGSLRRRALTLAVASLALIGAGGLVTQVPMEFVPAEDRSSFQVRFEAPPGTPLEQTTQALEKVAHDLRENAPGVEDTLTTVGGGAQGQVNEGSIQVNLISSKQRDFSQQDLMAWVRERYAGLSQAKLTVGEESAGGAEAPIQYNLRGDDLDQLLATADKLAQGMKAEPGFVDVKISIASGRPELGFEVDRERAASLGVPVSTVASAVRALMAGDAVSELKQGGESYDIVVKLPEEDRQDIANLDMLQVRSVTGQLVDLRNLVTSKESTSATKIEREDRQRQVVISANLEGLVQGDAAKKVEELAKTIVSSGVRGEMGGNVELMMESFGYMFEALLIAILLVYMILAAQFDSFSQPITIMVSLPLSLIGAFGALFLAGMSLSIFSMIGVIMLMGLVTKNAILLVDFAEQLRRSGKEMHEALVEAGRLRLRPILMTALSMIFGMMPVALAISEGGESRAPMAVCVIGGVTTSTVLTLIVVPVIYTLVEGATNNRLTRWIAKKFFSQGAKDQPSAGAHA